MNHQDNSVSRKSPLQPNIPEGTEKTEKTSKWKGVAVSNKVQSWMVRIAEVATNIMRRVTELTSHQSKKVELSKTQPNSDSKKATAKSNEAAKTIKSNVQVGSALSKVQTIPVSIAPAKPAITDCPANIISLIDSSKYAKIKELYPEIYSTLNKKLSEKDELHDQDVQKTKESTFDDSIILFITEKIIGMSIQYPMQDPSDGTSFQEFLYKDSLAFPKHEDAASIFKEFVELKVSKIQEKANKNPALQNDLTKFGTNPTFQEANQFVQDFEKLHGRLPIMTPKK